MPPYGVVLRGVDLDRVEDSIRVRALVAAIVLVAMSALIVQGAADVPTSAGSLILAPIGYVVSYRRRRERNWLLKFVLAAAALLALAAFLERVRTAQSFDDTRVALASLFLWVQVIHSFDVPRRRDLAFSTAASLILMAEAGSLSLDTSFAVFLIAYAFLGAVWLYWSHRSAAEAVATGIAPARAGARTHALPWRTVATLLLVGIVASTGVFLATPRLKGVRVVAPPFSIAKRIPVVGFAGGIVNPGLLARRGAGGAAFAPGAYPGFGDRLDLRGRGHLSDDIVMKVRATQGAFWRAQAYDVFDGTTWTASDTTTRTLNGKPISIGPRETPNIRQTTELIQTFYIEAELPNVVFAAYEPLSLFFPDGEVDVDRFGSIRSPFFLEPDTVYSVISAVPDRSNLDPTEDEVRAGRTGWDRRDLAIYTQLPPDLPDRVSRLAHEITDVEPTVQGKVLAVERWLGENTRYNLDIPADPPGVDAVDHFLFERREGFCEHIASAMTILLRALGIPARFVVGFAPGERNLFTGYFEVRESDAHSWVEVNYPHRGWVEYDPTHEVPEAEVSFGARFIAGPVFAAIGKFLGAVIPAPVRAFAQAAARATASGVRRFAPGLATAALLVVAIAVPLGRVRARRRRPRLTGASAAFVQMCEMFARRGRPRAPSDTPSEYLDRLVSADELARAARADVEEIVRSFERARFAKPAAPDGEAALAAAERLRQAAWRAKTRSVSAV